MGERAERSQAPNRGKSEVSFEETDSSKLPASASPSRSNHPDGSSNLLEHLTTAQRRAVTHVDGPLLILAGPGSGKTRVVTHRIAYLIEKGVRPYEIVALTFTNKAAEEMNTRLSVLAPGQKIWAGTFHAFCARLLRQHASLVGLQSNFSIYDIDEQKKAIKQAIERNDSQLGRHSADQIRQEISRAKNNLVAPDDYPSYGGDGLQFITAEVYPSYQQVLLESNAVDFDDLLMHSALLLKANPELRSSLDERFRYILVDEYQDTNFAQYALAHALSIDYPNLSVTGDPDQSIYGWRGATIKNILGFERDFPEVNVVRLEQNYRSTKNILKVADQLISHNTQRKRKELFTENEEGKPVELLAYPDESMEAESIAERIATALSDQDRQPNEFAILYRTNAHSRQVERALRLRGIPYQVVKGTEFYQRKEIKDVLAYLMLINNPQHNVAFERIVNVPPRKIGKVTLDRVRQYAWEHHIPFLQAAREAGQIPSVQKRTVGSLKRFVELMDRLTAQQDLPIGNLIDQILLETGYREHLQLEDTDEADDRQENLDELVNAAAEYAARNEEADLDSFLQQVALVADTDAWEGEQQRVTLMTLHAAKGLEFPTVFIIGLEEGTLPHQRSKDVPEQVEEERRLLFVGITRAEKELVLSLAKNRMRQGRPWPTVPSSFLMELPRDEMDVAGLKQRIQTVAPTPWEDGFESTGGGFGYSSGSFGRRRAEADFDEPSWQLDADPPELPEHSTGSQLASHHQLDDLSETDDEVSEFRVAKPTRKTQSTSPQFAAPASNETSVAGNDSEPAWDQTRRVSPAVFAEGMLVNHPVYGAGTILRLSGSGNKRTATVEFYAEGAKTFRLAFSPLVPAEPE